MNTKIINFKDKATKIRNSGHRVLADVQIIQISKGQYAYNIKGRIKNSRILNEALLIAAEHILTEMLVFNNNPDLVLELLEDLAEDALNQILGVGDD